MASQWYCRVEDQEYGPFTSPQLKQMSRDRQLLPEHQVRQGAEGRWILASQVQGLFAAAPAKPIKQAAPLAARVSDSSLVVSPVSPGPSPPPVAIPVSVTPVTPVGAIPMGVPVGAVPVGIPVEPAQGGGVPVAVVPVGFPVVTTAAPVASSYESEGVPVGKKKSQAALYATIGMAACLVVLVAVGGAVGLGFFKSKPAEKKELAAADTGSKEKEPEENFDPEAVAANQSLEPTVTVEKAADAKAKPAKSASAAKQGGSPAKPEAASKVETPGKPNKIQVKIISDVANNKGWRDTSSVKSVTSDNVKMMITATWFGGESAESTAEPADAGAEEPKPAKSTGKPRYVYVEVRLENTKGPGIVGYKSWNGAGKKPEETTAILLDSEGRVCPPVSREQVPDAGRRQTEDLPLGKAITDVLVFEAPAGDFDYVRVGLPYAALGRNGALGFQIPRDKIALNKGALAAATAPTAPGAAAAPKPPAATEDTGGQPATINELSGAINKPPVKKPVDPDAPPSAKELDKQLQDAKKLEAQQKAAEQKAAEDKAAGNKSP